MFYPDFPASFKFSVQMPGRKAKKQALSPDNSQSKRPTYTRSRTGCLTCRVKKIKCDEVKPNCTRCAHGQRDCAWPAASAPKESPLVKHPRKEDTAVRRGHWQGTSQHNEATQLQLGIPRHQSRGGPYTVPGDDFRWNYHAHINNSPFVYEHSDTLTRHPDPTTARINNTHLANGNSSDTNSHLHPAHTSISHLAHVYSSDASTTHHPAAQYQCPSTPHIGNNHPAYVHTSDTSMTHHLGMVGQYQATRLLSESQNPWPTHIRADKARSASTPRPPQHAAAIVNAAAKTRQILIERNPGTAVWMAELTEKELVEKARIATTMMPALGASDPPHDARFIGATRNRSGGWILHLNTTAAATWLKKEIEDFLAAMGGTSVYKERFLSVVVQFVPVSFNPTERGALQAIEADNGLQSGSFGNARWIKQPWRRHDGQRVAHAVFNFTNAAAANRFIRNGGWVEGSQVFGHKFIAEPIRCLRCQGIGHIVAECTSIHPSCARCAAIVMDQVISVCHHYYSTIARCLRFNIPYLPNFQSTHSLLTVVMASLCNK
ncbi:hypothetical protein R3P38DRAFT_3242282 [Favolaschia claudopus]|uniref:Zn(2)-C6 fungal-type domain-containing protein n=1 Tax=Favolaschia claudopus TaxID=2862362 RepID=A0AAV9Z4L9_9AGAR